MKFYSGHMLMVVPGIKIHVMVLLDTGILKFYNGHVLMVVLGMNGHVLVLLKMGILKFYNGRALMDAPVSFKSDCFLTINCYPKWLVS